MADERRIRTRFAVHTSMRPDDVLDAVHEALQGFELAKSGPVPIDMFVSVCTPCPQPCPVRDPHVVHWHDARWEGELYLWTGAADRQRHALAVRAVGEYLDAAALGFSILDERDAAWHRSYDD